MTAGYSGTPLVRKLGIEPGHRVVVVGAPREFEDTLGALPVGTRLFRRLASKRPYDVAILFVKSRAKLHEGFDRLSARLQPAGGLWVAWPKRASKVATDMTEDAVRDVALPRGWVDNKVCAIDETWSGLRCVLRKENRPAEPRERPKRAI